MDRFVYEILELIFSFLEFDQLIILRNVCPHWKFVIEHMISSKPLWLKKFDENSHYYRFFGVNKIYENHHFNITCSLVAFRLCDQIHPLLKKLVTYNPLVLNGLKLDNLLHLEIKNSKEISRDGLASFLEIFLPRNNVR